MLSALLAAAWVMASQEPPPVERVVIVSVDGLRPEFYLDEGWEMAHLRSWAREGAHAKGAESVFPSLTYPAHATILTGVRPRRHGIPGNTKFGEQGATQEWYWEAKDLKARTLWQAARDRGMKSATLFWPSSVGAPCDWLIAERWPVFEGEKLGRLLTKHSTPGLIAEIALTNGLPDDANDRNHAKVDRFMSDALAYVMKRYRPQLALLHLLQADQAQHREGREGPEVREAVRNTDQNLGRLRKALEAAGLMKGTLLIVTGDHGFIDVKRQVFPNVVLARAGLVGLDGGKVKDWRALAHTYGGSAAIYVKAGDKEAETKAREALEAAAVAEGRRRYTVLGRDRLDALGFDAGPSFALEAEDGWGFAGSLVGEAETAIDGKGSHGYLPGRDRMLTGFVAVGAGVKAGAVLGRISLVDVAPTVAAVLRLEMKDVEGRVLSEFLK